MARCTQVEPALYRVDEADVRCLLYDGSLDAAIGAGRIPGAGAAPCLKLLEAPLGPLLETKGLTRHFRVGGLHGRIVHAVDDLDMHIEEREIVALVGESGSGKSTVARLLAMVYRPTSGEVLFRGRQVESLRRRRDLLEYRGEVPMVFQDPFSSLNPSHMIGYALLRGLKLHRPELSRRDRQAEAVRVLEIVGLVPPAQVMSKYPHELSGGQRQRVGFAQALSYQPQVDPG